MNKEREDEVMAKVFGFDSDVDSEEALSEWVEQQPDAIEIHKLIADTLNAFT
jgi:hypothetical protein